MKELLKFFSLTAEGDVPVGLREIRTEQKLNHPTIEEQREVSFAPLFNQYNDFNGFNNNYTSASDQTSGLKWLNYIGNEKK